MSAEFNFDGEVALVTGVGGALGSAVANAFLEAGATVYGSDIIEPNTEDFLLSEPERVGWTTC
jgi:NAD(P)-dependent dehydrogenase (short-subunit alcohol dehydrogenase family)